MSRRDLYKMAAVTAILVAGFAALASYYRREERQVRTQQVAKQTRIAKRAPVGNSVFVRPHSRGHGPSDAKVTVVEFFDPECESCRVMHPIVKELQRRYEGQVRFVVRYMPLHPNSMYAAGALEAAGDQGRYWEMLDVLFEKQPEWGGHHHPRPELIPGYAREVGLDMEAFEAFLREGEYRTIVETDQADGRALGVRMTPSFFVNGRPLERLGAATLQALIEEELAR